MCRAAVSSIGDPTAERGGRYVLRPAGAADLARSLQAIEDMTQGMDKLLASLPGAGGR